MAQYVYKATDASGNTVKGEIDAASEAAALGALAKRSLEVYQIRLRPPQFEIGPRKRLKPKDRARFVRQLATLLKAGVELPEALASLGRSRSHPEVSKAANAMLKDLRAGGRLSDALPQHIPGLPQYISRLAELGEATGQLASSLMDAADRMEFEESLRGEIRTALAYPAFLAIVGTALVFLLFVFVVPRFAQLIGDNTDSIPTVSRIVIGLGVSTSENWLWVLLAAIGLSVVAVTATRDPRAQATFKLLLERAPFIGSTTRRAQLGTWAATVGVALKNGADLLLALRLGEDSLVAPRLRTAMRTVRARVRTGQALETVLGEEVPDLDPLTLDLIRTGRASGQLSDMLLFTSKLHEEDTRQRTQRISALAEPIAILLISGVVGTVVVSIVLAMTSVYDFAI